MADDMSWTPLKSLTFFDRMNLTWFLSRLAWKELAASVKITWSSGATVSFSPTDPRLARKITVTGNERQVTVEVTDTGTTLTAK